MATMTAAVSEAELLRNPPKGFIYAAFCVVIILQYLYVFSYNWFPALRVPLSGSLTAIHVLLATLTVLLRPAPWNLLLVLSAALMIATFIPAHALGIGEVGSFDVQEAIRKLVPPILLIWMLAYPLALPRRLLWCCAVVGVLLSTMLAFTGDPVIASGEPRLASITAGFGQYKPSAKLIALQLILIDLLRRGRIMAPVLSWGLIALCVLLLAGYGGRAEMVMIFVYYLFFAYRAASGITVVRVSPLLLLVVVVTISFIALSIGEDVNKWGSGRIGHWSGRLELLAQRELVTFVFGGGVGSDIFVSPEWWWNEDGHNAHNDFLYFFTEHGVTGLFIVFCLLLGPWLRCGDSGRAILLSLVANSFLDNGFLRSPLHAANLGLILSLAVFVDLLRETETHAANAKDENQRNTLAPPLSVARR